jgi:hypothetical protein
LRMIMFPLAKSSYRPPNNWQPPQVNSFEVKLPQPTDVAAAAEGGRARQMISFFFNFASAARLMASYESMKRAAVRGALHS